MDGKPPICREAERGAMLIYVIVAMGLVAILMPLYQTFIAKSIQTSELQNIEADLEDLRILLRGRFDCNKTKAHLESGVSQLTSCQSATSPILIKAIDRNQIEILNKDAPSDDRNWLGRYHVQMKCGPNPSPPGGGELYFEVRKENAARSAPVMHPTKKTPMTWGRLFKVSICDW